MMRAVEVIVCVFAAKAVVTSPAICHDELFFISKFWRSSRWRVQSPVSTWLWSVQYDWNPIRPACNLDDHQLRN